MAERVEIYCQECGKSLTDKGAYVSFEGFAFCQNPSSELGCLENFSFTGEISIFEGENLSAENLQDAIRSRKLIHYGNLEKTV